MSLWVSAVPSSVRARAALALFSLPLDLRLAGGISSREDRSPSRIQNLRFYTHDTPTIQHKKCKKWPSQLCSLKTLWSKIHHSKAVFKNQNAIHLKMKPVTNKKQNAIRLKMKSVTKTSSQPVTKLVLSLCIQFVSEVRWDPSQTLELNPSQNWCCHMCSICVWSEVASVTNSGTDPGKKFETDPAKNFETDPLFSFVTDPRSLQSQNSNLNVMAVMSLQSKKTSKTDRGHKTKPCK